MKRICLIGSGNVAEALACALSALGSDPTVPTDEQFRLDRIYARNRDRGRAIAQMVGCTYTDNQLNCSQQISFNRSQRFTNQTSG